MAFEHGEMLEQCSQSQTFFVIQFAEEARASSEERKSNYHLVQVAIFMSRVEEEVVFGNHIPTFFSEV